MPLPSKVKTEINKYEEEKVKTIYANWIERAKNIFKKAYEMF